MAGVRSLELLTGVGGVAVAEEEGRGGAGGEGYGEQVITEEGKIVRLDL